MAITITTSSLSGRNEITLADGATAADLFEQGHVTAGAVLRQAGKDVSLDTILVDGGNYVITPPAAKHGLGDITIVVSGLAGRQEITVPVGTTAADLYAQGIVTEGSGLRQGGQTVPNHHVLIDGGNYVTTPPAAKHGA